MCCGSRQELQAKLAAQKLSEGLKMSMGSNSPDGGPMAAYREVHDEGAQPSSEEDWSCTVRWKEDLVVPKGLLLQGNSFLRGRVAWCEQSMSWWTWWIQHIQTSIKLFSIRNSWHNNTVCDIGKGQFWLHDNRDQKYRVIWIDLFWTIG